MLLKRQSIFAVFIAVLFAASSAYAARNLPDFTHLIEDKSPAVVKINTTTKSKLSRLGVPPNSQVPDIFRHLFDPRDLKQRDMHSMGSGFFISSDGYILTNNHVIEEADEIVVRLTDRREFEAKIVGVDPTSDLALLKVDQTNLPFLDLAENDDLKVGEWVVAIGAPFGLDFSASVGIVSAKGRSIPNEEGDYVPFIQTDVAINPGNSGGPLFNMDGDVVGVNSQIYTRSGGSIGLSFAIPSTVAKNVVTQLKKKGRVERGWLGVVIQEVDRNLAESFGLKKPHGALVTRMEEDGPAHAGGIEVGDIIVRFGDASIDDRADLPHVVGLTPPDTDVPVVVMRKGKRRELTVRVTSREGGLAAGNAQGGSAPASVGDRLGVVVVEVARSELQHLRLKGGVKVREVDPAGPAAEAGVEAGDIIAQIGYEEIRTVAAYQSVVAQLPQNTLLPIRFFKRDNPVFRTITLGK